MQKLTRADLLNLDEYERVRGAYRREIIAYKRDRRIRLGPHLLLTFENRKTIRFQIQEMIRAERMVADDQIQTELDVYNTLLPAPGELSATLFIEITKRRLIRPLLKSFIGLTADRTIWFQVGGQQVYAQFEAGREATDKISSVHYLRFPFASSSLEAFRDSSQPAVLEVVYRDYRHTTPLNPALWASLQADLE